MRPQRPLTALLAALILSVVPASASAAPVWRGAVNGPANNTSDAQVVFDTSGNAVAVWRKSSSTGGDSVWSAVAPAGSSTFGSTKRISAAPAAGDVPEVSDLSLAVDAQSNVVAAWAGAYTSGATPLAVAAVRSAGSWNAPVAVSDAAATGVHVAFGTAGVATLIWSQESADYLQVRVASIATATGAVAPVQTIAPSSAYASDPHLAFDGNGNGFVTWLETKVSFSPPYTGTVALRSMGRKSGEATFTDSKQVFSTTTANITDSAIALDRGGNATIAWSTTSSEDGSPLDVYAATRLLGGSSWPGVKLSGGKAGSVDLAASQNGGAVMSWVEQPADGSTDDGVGTVKAARRAPATTSFATPLRVSALGETGAEPEVAAGAGGTTVISWIHPSSSGDTPRAAAMASGSSTFWDPNDLDMPGNTLGAPAGAVSANGDAVVLWQPLGGTQRVNRLDGDTVTATPTPQPEPTPTTPTPTTPTATTPTATTPAATTPSGSGTPSDPGTPTQSTPSTNDPGTPSSGTPSTGTPSTTTPSSGTPSTGTPSTDTPSSGTPTTGTPSTGTPSTGTPSTGTPSTGTPSTGTPSTVGNPVTSVPGATGGVGASVTVTGGSSVAKTPVASASRAPAPMADDAATAKLPSLRSFKALSAKRFTPADAGDGLVRRGDGVTLAFTGNYAGTLRVVVTSVPKNGRAKNLSPAMSAPVVAGTTKLVFTGRLAGKALPAGNYRLKALFVDDLGRASNLRILNIAIKR